ncbi:IS200/IS605 family transposase [Bacteroidota bacterium]
MPYLIIWVHLIWSTKNREAYLKKEIRQKVFDHIKVNAKEKNIYIDTINGYVEHVHCLVALKNDQTISNIMQLLKGESSFWINRNKLINFKFAWQDEYFAVSVSPSNVDKVREYIKNQEKHHQKKTFQQEYEEFISQLGFKRFKD